MDASPKKVKQALMEQYARIAGALSHHRRLAIIDLLCQRPHSVGELSQALGESSASASQHLQTLKRARLVDSEKRGLYVIYSLADDSVGDFWRALQSLGATRLAEVRQILHDFFYARDELEPVTLDEVAERMRNDGAVVIDVRPFAEYRHAHIPGALSIPLEELESRLGELPKDTEIIAYCRGPYCVQSPVALEILRNNGFQARRMREGLPDWKVAGFPLHRLDGRSGGSPSGDVR